MKPTSYGPGRAPVYLNVYDLTPMNGYVYWAGLGIYHSGVEGGTWKLDLFWTLLVHLSRLSMVLNMPLELMTIQQVVFLRLNHGSAQASSSGSQYSLEPHAWTLFQVREFMERQSASYNGDTYHLIVKNCNHFCKDICSKLTGKPVPKWVNRLAKIGSICNCMLPETLKISAVQHDPDYQPFDSDKRRLRGAFSCLSSISMRQKQLSTSSLFLQSPLRGCLPTWELRRSNNGSLKER
ncbi:hypothetical protein Patl1_09107 [Pistacia atlantica]|uniref:Uncharacterized protein n=1 Tax=Pistacia atlantica TaxID=434234 RepID=A0ACC1AL00_9ROSI|nr:hypothetical protein Patl1_09107 [Pistacia atlantica]